MSVATAARHTEQPRCVIDGEFVDLDDAWPVFEGVACSADHAQEYSRRLLALDDAKRAAAAAEQAELDAEVERIAVEAEARNAERERRRVRVKSSRADR